MPSPPEHMRIDKWLWAARFFKTRSLATEAISGGKIHVDGHRVKPAKDIRVGSEIRIRKNELEWSVTVLGLNTQRRPAPEARLLYEESEESRQRRVDQVAERQQQTLAQRERRPSKRGRRQIHRFKNQYRDG